MRKMLAKLFWSFLVAITVFAMRSEHGWWTAADVVTITCGLFLISDYGKEDA